MAKIVVYSMAYRGHVFPYVPIASGLARAGHDVVVVVPEEFHPLSHPSRSARLSRAVSEDPGSTSPIRRDRPCAGPRENLYSNIGCFPLVFQV